jgi:hypothetical protein
MLIGCVVDDELGHHLEPETVRLPQHGAEIVEGPVLRMHVLIVGDVVSVVPEGRRIERHQPDGVDPEVADVAELGREALEITDPVVVGVQEGLDVELIDDRVLVPERIIDIEPGECRGIQGRWGSIIHQGGLVSYTK